jgi:hypothetical protein
MSAVMLWVFERDKQTLWVETRFDDATKEYMLIVRRLDGTEQVERFKDSISFQVRIDSLREQLEAERWTSDTAISLRDGWKL